MHHVMSRVGVKSRGKWELTLCKLGDLAQFAWIMVSRPCARLIQARKRVPSLRPCSTKKRKIVCLGYVFFTLMCVLASPVASSAYIRFCNHTDQVLVFTMQHTVCNTHNLPDVFYIEPHRCEHDRLHTGVGPYVFNLSGRPDGEKKPFFRATIRIRKRAGLFNIDTRVSNAHAKITAHKHKTGVELGFHIKSSK